MKTKVAAYGSIIAIFGMILLHATWLSASVYARPVIPPSQLLPGGMYGHVFAGMVMFPAHQVPQYAGNPLLPAQQSCLGTAGWSWRESGFSMCFKPGHTACPAGHPWTRQFTRNYTICFSALSSGVTRDAY